MDKEKIIHLLKKYQQQTATAEEQAEFAEILHSKSHETLVNKLLDQRWDELDVAEINQIEIPNYDQILANIKQQPQIIRTKRLWPKGSIAAASILVLFGLGLYFLGRNKFTTETQFANDIAPGKNGATLTLANGKKIRIADILAGNIANESGVKISKTKDGQIIYEITATNDGTLSYNTLSTNRGEQTQVRLQDGTLVFLNAESSLKYPTSFAKTEKREVSLTGEAYFEVAKDKLHPFVVDASKQKVEVLGTTFNISSYTNEPSIKTTLLEGSVRIENLNSNITQILKPGEQALVKDLSLNVKPVEVDDVVAWKNGYFMFDNETLESIMKKVSRWYNVDVVFKDQSLKIKTFFGSVSRFDHVSEVLKLLQKTNGATFEINGNQIIVGQKK